MARLFTSGFEENTNTAGVEWTSTSGSPVIQGTTVRSGSFAGQVTSLASGTAKKWTYQFASADTSADFYFRFYFNIGSFHAAANTIIFGLLSSVSNLACHLELSTAGVLDIRDDSGVPLSGTTTLGLNQWYRIEVRHFNTSTTVELKVDGVSIALSTTATTNVIRDMAIGGNIANVTATGGNFFFEDVAINDANTGAGQTAYPGDWQIIVLRPNAAGDNNTFTVAVGGTAGAANNFTRVNEVTPDDVTSYNGAVTSGNTDDFNIDDTPSALNATSTIALVQVNVRYRALVAAAEAAFKTRIKKVAAGTVASSAAITPNSTTWKTNANAVPALPPQTLYVDPDGSAWTKATLDTTQIGYTISTTNTNAADISAIWLTVEYRPGAAASTSAPAMAMMGIG